ncbi:MAG TPA: sensor histidine kinase [Candidatus Dormibacteraeota bacterium]|nr:sensor histidine kinase [Candidatus Dormibacteraeota bacterium]
MLVLVLIEAVALFWRRRHPALTLVAVFVPTFVAWAIVPDREPSGPALVFAVYAVSVYDRSQARLWVAAAAIAVIVVAVTFLVLGDYQTARGLIPAAAISLVAWVIGDYIRSRRRFVVDLVARHRQEREQAAEDERLRIARELHDVVAHNVSAMAIQAGAARLAGDDGKEALASIEQTARDTLAELNKLLGVLRKASDAPLSPQPTLADAETLLRPAREAGLDTTLKVTGTRRDMPAAVELSAYRIIQEAVTNVLKHSGATRIEVTVDYGAAALNLTIADNGSGPANAGANGSGHGLIGMRERVELFGGDLSTGSSSLGGFVVRASLPVKT